MKTPTTQQLFRKLTGFKIQKGVRPGMIMPSHEIYYPRDSQGVRRMSFGWMSTGGEIGLAAYTEGSPFWGGIPM